jgi:phosphate transport system substrate-binding protein
VVISYTLGTTLPVSVTTFALDAIAISVPYTNPVESLTSGQAREIFAGRTVSWTEVGGRDVAVQPFSREEGAVIRQVVEAWALGTGTRVTRNALMISSEAGMVAELEAEPGGIGYALLRHLSQRVRPLRLGGVAPSAAAIQQGQYPLALRLSTLTAGAPAGPAAAFVAYLRGSAGQQLLQAWGLVAAR